MLFPTSNLSLIKYCCNIVISPKGVFNVLETYCFERGCYFCQGLLKPGFYFFVLSSIRLSPLNYFNATQFYVAHISSFKTKCQRMLANLENLSLSQSLIYSCHLILDKKEFSSGSPPPLLSKKLILVNCHLNVSSRGSLKIIDLRAPSLEFDPCSSPPQTWLILDFSSTLFFLFCFYNFLYHFLYIYVIVYPSRPKGPLQERLSNIYSLIC